MSYGKELNGVIPIDGKWFSVRYGPNNGNLYVQIVSSLLDMKVDPDDAEIFKKPLTILYEMID